MKPYFEQHILSADPVELIRILYQRALASTRDARVHLERREIELRSRAIGHAYAAIGELNSSLKIEAAPDLAGRLRGLYLYMQQRLLSANVEQADAPLVEVLGLLTTLSEAWSAVPVTPAPKPEAAHMPWQTGDRAGDEPVRYALSA